MIYLGADHRGFSLKESLKSYLLEQGYSPKDFGALAMDVSDDYPDFAIPVARAVAAEPGARGILICGSGHGMDIVANKHKGVRAALCFNTAVAKQSREHEDANVLVLASDWLKQNDAEAIVKTWLDTEFGGAERNVRRIKKINDLE